MVNGSQIMSKSGKNKKVVEPSLSLMFLPHFDAFCNVLLSRPMTAWNLLVLYDNTKVF